MSDFDSQLEVRMEKKIWIRVMWKILQIEIYKIYKLMCLPLQNNNSKFYL